MNRTRTLGTLSTAAAALVAVAAPIAEARRVPKSITCKISLLESKASPTWNGGVLGFFDALAALAVCGSQNATGQVSVRATLTFANQGNRRPADPKPNGRGVVFGPVVLHHGFGATRTGNSRATANGTYSCSADACVFKGELVGLEPNAGKFTGSFNLDETGTHGFRVKFEDVIVSS